VKILYNQKVKNSRSQNLSRVDCADLVSLLMKSLKNKKNGNVHRYVYYGCTKFRDKNCKCGYMREEKLIEDLLEIINTIHLDQIGIKEKIKQEIQRYNKFRIGILNEDESMVKIKDVDIRNYTKYILREGNIYEKRELLVNLRSRLVMKNKKIII